MGNKQEELELRVQLQGYNPTGTTERCGGISHTSGVLQWTGTSSLGRQGRRVVHYLRKQQESTESCLGPYEDPAGSLWARVRWQTNMGFTVVGVSCRLPDP